MTNNPIEVPAPTDPMERVHTFARDLAYGVAMGLWNTRFTVMSNDRWEPNYIADGNPFYGLIHEKWESSPPSHHILQSLGYMQVVKESQYGTPTLLLQEKAFALLDTPIDDPSVFISYSRSSSSTFALLVEARLRIAGNANVFVDKNIIAGEDWLERLHGQINDSRYFVLLVGADTLSKEWVLKEIEWAVDAGCTIISIWHGDTRPSDTSPDVLNRFQHIIVDAETAKHYETAIAELLNSMGYATY